MHSKKSPVEIGGFFSLYSFNFYESVMETTGFKECMKYTTYYTLDIIQSIQNFIKFIIKLACSENCRALLKEITLGLTSLKQN